MDKSKEEIVKKLEEIQSKVAYILRKKDDPTKAERHQVVWLVEQNQLLHQLCHQVASIASSPPITDLARNRVKDEVSRLKDVVKWYREQAKREGLELCPQDL